MRIAFKNSSENITNKDGSVDKKVTLTKTLKVTVGDIIGTVAGAKNAASELKKKASDPTLAKSAVKNLIAPVVALITAVDVVKKIIDVSAVVTPVVNMAARGSGIAFSPGNVVEIIKMGINIVFKMLVALALNAVVLLKEMVWNYEIDLYSLSASDLVRLTNAVTKSGKSSAEKIAETIKNLNGLNNPAKAAAISNSSPTWKKTLVSSPIKATIATTADLPVPIEIGTIYKVNGPPIEYYIYGDNLAYPFFIDFENFITPKINSSVTNTLKALVVNNATIDNATIDNTIKEIYSNTQIIKGTVDTFGALPNPAFSGNIYKVIGPPTLYYIYNEENAWAITDNDTLNYLLLGSDEKSNNFGVPVMSNEISPLRTVLGNDSIFKIHKNDSIINWQTDVGMADITPITFYDLINYTASDVVLSDYNNIENTDLYNELIKSTKNYLNQKLLIMKINMGLEIDSVKLDIVSLVDGMDLEGKKTMLALSSEFQGAAKAIFNQLTIDYLTAMLNFNENQIKELIYASLYETEILYRSNLRNFLITLNNGKVNFDWDISKSNSFIDNYNILFQFEKGLDIAFINYLNTTSNNTYILNRENDLDIIALAADFFKTQERAFLIGSIRNKYANINTYNKPLDISGRYTSNYYVCITDLETALTAYAFTTNDLLKIFIKNFIKNYNIIISTTDSLDNIEAIKGIIDITRLSFFAKLEEIKDSLLFQTFNSFENDFPAEMSVADRIKAYQYLTEIHNKFLERISELAYLSYENLTDYKKEQYPSIIEKNILNSKNKIKELLYEDVVSTVNTFIIETGNERKAEIISSLKANSFISPPSMNIVETNVYYYLSDMKTYFLQNVGVL